MLLTNMLLKNNEGLLERIVFLDAFICYTISLTENNMPIKKLVTDIKKAIELGTIHICKEEGISPLKMENLPDNQKEMTHMAYKIVSNVFEKLGDKIFNKQMRGKIVREVAKEFSISSKTIYKYLKRYWQGGMNMIALVPQFSNCGAKGKERQIGENSLGRKRDDGIGSFKVTDKVKKAFKSILERYFYHHKRLTIVKCYYLMLKEYFNDTLDKVGAYPSFGQFRYFFYKTRDIKKEYCKRVGEKEYNQKHREMLGSSNHKTIPALVQIDSTIGDIYLVSNYDRTKLVGRPVITIATDVLTRKIVGITVGYESPSWKTTMSVLSSIAGDKKEYCASFGIEIEDNEWSVKNMIPNRIVTDRGPEFLNNNMQEVVNNLGIVVEYTPSYRPDLKSVVERMIGKVQDEFRGFVEGEVSDDIRKKANKYDYRMTASLTLYEYIQLIIKAILHHNNHHVLKDYRRSEDMVIKGINPIPKDLWEYTNNHLLGYNYVDSDFVNLCVMNKDRASVTSKGIRFKGLLYGCDRGIKEQWFISARRSGNYKVDVSYDPRNTNKIYVHVNGEYEIATLLNHQDVFKDKSYEEISVMLKAERNLIQSLEEEHLKKTVEFYGEIQEIGNVKAVNTGESKMAKLKDIKLNKEVEIRMNSAELSGELKSTEIEINLAELDGDWGDGERLRLSEDDKGKGEINKLISEDKGNGEEQRYVSPFEKFMKKRMKKGTDNSL